jgi:recombination protein RecT
MSAQAQEKKQQAPAQGQLQTRPQGQQQNGQMVSFKQKVDSVRGLLSRMQGQIAMALPKHMKAERLARIVMTTVQNVPKLLDCTPESLIRCVLQAAQLGLEPDGLLGQAYLIPFENKKKQIVECTLIVGYKGLLKLARNSGEIASIEAHAVRVGDEFSYAFGTEGFLKHKPAEAPLLWKEKKEKDVVVERWQEPDYDWNPGRITHFYAVAKLKDGTRQFEVMPVWEVNDIRDNSQGYKAAKNFGIPSPWIDHYPEMGKKTVLRRICKMLPASIELARAVALDEAADAGIDQNLGDVIEIPPEQIEGGEAEPASKLDRLAAESKAKREGGEEKPAEEAPEPGTDG